MAPMLSPGIRAAMRGREEEAKQVLQIRQNDVAVLDWARWLQRYHSGNAVPLRHTSLPPASPHDPNRPALQPFNSVSIFGSKENFARAASLLKYSNPHEGPR